jgi:hypothetical protein
MAALPSQCRGIDDSNYKDLIYGFYGGGQEQVEAESLLYGSKSDKLSGPKMRVHLMHARHMLTGSRKLFVNFFIFFEVKQRWARLVLG